MRTIFIVILAFLSVSICYGQEQEDLTTIILIRHAEKLDDGKDPDLSPEGHDRALKLKSILQHSEITAIYSTPYKRTMNTVVPLAQEMKMEVQQYNPSNKDFIQFIYQQNKGKTILVSGHSNTTPMAVNVLLKTEKYKTIDHEEYGRIFIVTISSTEKTNVLEIRY